MNPAASNHFFESHCVPPAMAILRGHTRRMAIDIARVARDAGIALIEIPLQSSRDVQALMKIADPVEGITAGAGTVTTVELVEVAAQAGAHFTVSPGFDHEVAHRSLELGMAHLPGVATATEIQAVSKQGLNWVKAFPASVLTPAWFSAMSAPFPSMRAVASGGIDLGNAEEFLTHGAAMVTFGSALSDAEQVIRIKHFFAQP